MYEVKVLRAGYAEWHGPAVQKANGTITLIKGKYNLIVDTGNPTDKNTILRALRKEKLEPNNIDYVICTHGHSDHVSNNNVFPQATFIVSYDISKGDEYTFHNFAKQGPYKIDDDIEIVYTPGHTKQDITVVLKTPHGIVSVTGDLFESEKDLSDDQLWRQFSEYPEEQQISRRKILEVSDYIVPGHGDIFEVKKSLVYPAKHEEGGKSNLGIFFLQQASEIHRQATRFTHFWAPVDESLLLAWLKQFPETEGKCVALKLLRGIEFFGPLKIAELMQKLHLLLPKEYEKVYLTGLGPEDKSGYHLLYEYRLANQIEEKERTIEISNIDKILDGPEIEQKTVIFLDDIIGTGNEATKFYSVLAKQHDKKKLDRVQKYFIALVGTEWGIKEVKSTGVFTNVLVARTLTETDRAFSSKRDIFDSEEERIFAKKMVGSIGRKLCPRDFEKKGLGPFGYGDCELLIVFHYNTPNNTLPIFWKSGIINSHQWVPLLPRRE